MVPSRPTNQSNRTRCCCTAPRRGAGGRFATRFRAQKRNTTDHETLGLRSGYHSGRYRLPAGRGVRLTVSGARFALGARFRGRAARRVLLVRIPSAGGRSTVGSSTRTRSLGIIDSSSGPELKGPARRRLPACRADDAGTRHERARGSEARRRRSRLGGAADKRAKDE